jgi:phenylacetate-CoA ligase
MQRCSKEVVLRAQNNKLKELVRFAYTTSPYYGRRFNELGLGNRIESGEYEISELPVLEKDDVRSCGEKILSNAFAHGKLRKGHTGGSTGVPVKFFFDSISAQKGSAALRLFFSWCGWKPGERTLFLWGARQDLTMNKSIRKNIRVWLSGEKILPAYEFDEQTMAKWVLEINKYRPCVLYGYASILSALANFVLETGSITPSFKGVYTTAEMLHPAQRAVIEEAFGCKVYNQYGCREIPGVASECRAGNLHILTDMALVETIESKSGGQGKELVITSLSNRAMPFIRYRVGDLGELKGGRCSCGLPFPMLEIGLGRTNDILVTEGGKRIYPSYFIHLFDDFPEIRDYQVRQKEWSHFLLNLKRSQTSDALVKKLGVLESRMRRDFGEGIKLDISLVEEIQKTPAGKHQFIVSDITSAERVQRIN